MPTRKLSATQKSSSTLIAIVALAAFAFTLVPAAHAQTETILFSLLGTTDGHFSRSGVVFDSVGNLYGTTQYGGGSANCSLGCGAVYEISPVSGGGWTETVLHTFTGGSDGGDPYGGVVVDSAGNVYGTTSQGGNLSASACAPHGCGVVFELSPNGSGGWTETVLHAFSGERDGAAPWTGLILDSTGNLYGTTASGGNLTASLCAPYGCGVVFELSPVSGGWKENVLHGFVGTDGWIPFGTLTFDSLGNLYGTTLQGRRTSLCQSSGCGVVFELSPVTGGWHEKVLHSFDGTDGSLIEGGVAFDSAGNLYGTAAYGGGPANGCDGEGCGTCFELSPTTHGPWTFTGLHVFSGVGADAKFGYYPSGSLFPASDGSLYGVTDEGGSVLDGVAFKLSLVSGVWKETLIHTFGSTKGDGSVPYNGFVSDAAGNLYGATATGGANGAGTVFKITP
jgi:uncharacterized repeat protein (TIGR03803 family)